MPRRVPFPLLWITRFVLLGTVGVAASVYALYRSYHREPVRHEVAAPWVDRDSGEIEAPEIIVVP